MAGIITPVGLSLSFWSIVGCFRYLNDKDRSSALKKRGWVGLSSKQLRKASATVAVCLPAHNEELVIGDAITSLKKFVSAKQIYVACDASADRTAAIARAAGCPVLELTPAHGKARAMEALIEHFTLLDHYNFIITADADTIFDHDYLKNALKMFMENPQTAAIAGYARSAWSPGWRPTIARYFLAYRSRQYLALQWMMAYGQTWRLTPVTAVIPGFASIYRSNVLRQLRIYVPGIAIEDFNLAFQIHRQKLGTIGHHSSIAATTQDPDNFTDYINQITRWNSGFWQTVQHWKIWPSWLWLALGCFLIELLVFSLFLLLSPLYITTLFLVYGGYLTLPITSAQEAFTRGFFALSWGIYLGVFIVDYLITLLVALKARKYFLLFYGPAFIFLRVADAIILLLTTPYALINPSLGYWTSPVRRAHKPT